MTVMKSPHCFVSLLLCAALLLSSLSGTALATETASVFEFDYAFEEYWYDDEAPAALVGDFPVRSALLMEAESGRILFQMEENKPAPDCFGHEGDGHASDYGGHRQRARVYGRRGDGQ